MQIVFSCIQRLFFNRKRQDIRRGTVQFTGNIFLIRCVPEFTTDLMDSQHIFHRKQYKSKHINRKAGMTMNHTRLTWISFLFPLLFQYRTCVWSCA